MPRRSIDVYAAPPPPLQPPITPLTAALLCAPLLFHCSQREAQCRPSSSCCCSKTIWWRSGTGAFLVAALADALADWTCRPARAGRRCLPSSPACRSRTLTEPPPASPSPHAPHPTSPRRVDPNPLLLLSPSGRYVNGRHYSQTLEAWLRLHDAARLKVRVLFEAP